MLLDDAHINTIMNARSLRTYRVYTGIPVQPEEVYSDPQCAVALFNTTVPAYSTSGYVAARGKKIAENLNSMAHEVDEAVVAFQSPSEASKFVGSARAAWKDCGGGRVTYTGTDRVVQPWTFGMPRIVGEIIAINNETIDRLGMRTRDGVEIQRRCRRRRVRLPHRRRGHRDVKAMTTVSQ